MFGKFIGNGLSDRHGAQWDIFEQRVDSQTTVKFSEYANENLKECARFKFEDRQRVALST